MSGPSNSRRGTAAQPTSSATGARRADHGQRRRSKIIREDENDTWEVSPAVEQEDQGIILADEIGNDASKLQVRIARAAAKLPKPPTQQGLERHLLGGTAREAEDYIREQLKPKVRLLVGVGHQSLYWAVQAAAEVHALLEAAPGGRGDVLRSYLGVKRKCAKPIHAVVHSLFGLPDRELGQEARTAASNRHGKYAMSIRGAQLSGIHPHHLAEELSRVGLSRLAEIARHHDRSVKAAERGEIEEAEAPAEQEEVEEAADGGRTKTRALAPASRHPDAVRRWRVELITSEDYADRITKRAGIVLCLVDRSSSEPELFDGLALPERYRHDRAGAYAWVKAALKAAEHEDLHMEAEDENDADEV